jgi:hypothetical protein
MMTFPGSVMFGFIRPFPPGEIDRHRGFLYSDPTGTGGQDNVTPGDHD